VPRGAAADPPAPHRPLRHQGRQHLHPVRAAPVPGRRQPIHLEYENLKLIDFAFAVAHAIPLTQILVINPDERLPVPVGAADLGAARRPAQRLSQRGPAARLPRRSLQPRLHGGEDQRGGLDCPSGTGDARVLEDIRSLVQRLKAFDSTSEAGPLPHDELIAEIDQLLVATAGPSASLQFHVDGEWTAEEMAKGRGARAADTADARGFAAGDAGFAAVADAPRRSTGVARLKVPLLLAALCACVGAAVFFVAGEADTALPQPEPTAVLDKKVAPELQPPPPAPAEDAARILALLRSDEDAVFRTAFGNLAKIPANGAAIAEAITAEYAAALASASPREMRSRALGRLIWMAKAGNELAAHRVAAFERSYDVSKLSVAKSSWWLRGEGAPPAEAVSWVENGELLAEHGDRPAMLDVAFAIGHGRGIPQDRARSVETYLKAMASSAGADEFSIRVRQSAARGLTVMLNRIVEQKDRDAAVRLVPALQSNADAGAAGCSITLGSSTSASRGRPTSMLRGSGTARQLPIPSGEARSSARPGCSASGARSPRAPSARAADRSAPPAAAPARRAPARRGSCRAG
jgi:hypothetical protein